MQIIIMNQNRPVVLDEDGLADFIDSKSNRVIRRNFLQDCARYIIAHNGVNTGGGCPAHVTYQGRAVFHESRGQRGNNDGCSVFFSTGAALGRSDVFATAILLAVGRHDRDVGGQPHYTLDWKHRGWYQGNSIQF